MLTETSPTSLQPERTAATLAPVVPVPLPTDFHRPVFCLLGIAFDQVTLAEAVERLGRAVRERHRLVLSTPNVNNIVAVQHDLAYRDAVSRCELVVPDGMPLVWMARLLGVPTRRVAGSDLFVQLMQGAAGPMRTFFFGAPEGVAEAACQRLNADAGPMRGAGWHYPGFGTVAEMAAPAVVQKINASAPDFVVVALGTAKGQQWIERIGPSLGAPILSHLGAVVNFVAGSVRRAPLPMQTLGLEWLWRIKEEPALWRRYAKDARALAGLVATGVLPLLLQRTRRALVPLRSTARLEMPAATGPVRRLVLAGDWRPEDLGRLRDALAALTRQDGPIEIDASQLGSVDLYVVGLLIRLYGHQHKRGVGFAIRHPSATLRRELQWHRASYLLADKKESG